MDTVITYKKVLGTNLYINKLKVRDVWYTKTRTDNCLEIVFENDTKLAFENGKIATYSDYSNFDHTQIEKQIRHLETERTQHICRDFSATEHSDYIIADSNKHIRHFHNSGKVILRNQGSYQRDQHTSVLYGKEGVCYITTKVYEAESDGKCLQKYVKTFWDGYQIEYGDYLTEDKKTELKREEREFSNGTAIITADSVTIDNKYLADYLTDIGLPIKVL